MHIMQFTAHAILLFNLILETLLAIATIATISRSNFLDKSCSIERIAKLHLAMAGANGAYSTST